MNVRTNEIDPAPFKFKLGADVKDIVTGFKGIIAGRTQYLTGCNRYCIQDRKLDKDGKPRDWIQLDENQLELVKSNAVKLDTTDPGGPRPSLSKGQSVHK
jgi:hypothetical protein